MIVNPKVDRYSDAVCEHEFTAGKTCGVLGLMYRDGELKLLVYDDSMIPVFVPYSNFDICDATLPEDWLLRCYETENEQVLIIGDEDLVADYDELYAMLSQGFDENELLGFLKNGDE